MSEGRLAVEPVDAYMPIFEALNWAAALDERIAVDAKGWSWRKRVSNGEVVAGLRFAHNRAHHQWAAVLYVTTGAILPTYLPMPLFEAVAPGPSGRARRPWQRGVRRPPPDVPARFTLERLQVIFEDAIASLLGD